MAIPTRSPVNTTHENTVKFLVHDVIPRVLETGIKAFAVLPQTNQYSAILKPGVKPFEEALNGTTEREFVISGVSSLLDYELFGHPIVRPTPHLAGTPCNAPSLCLEPTCLGLVEGMIESSNQIRNMCTSLSLGCLKDMLYSDRRFESKMKQYFAMHFEQPGAILSAYVRTRLLQESIKVVCVDRNINYSGPVIGGSNNIPLPFAMNSVDARLFPDLGTLGVEVGGANIADFMKFVAPRLMSGTFSQAGIDSVTWFGLTSSKETALRQTASTMDQYSEKSDRMSAATRLLSDKNFVHDGLFPKFEGSATGFRPIPADTLVASTIAGYVPEDNPEHNLALINGLLAVPSNWRYEMVEPPKDDFSFLGLGDALNFGMNTPGVKRLMSSAIFSKNQLAKDGVFYIGQAVNSQGFIDSKVTGVEKRKAPIREAVRTEVLLTYSDLSGNAPVNGQYAHVGSRVVTQKPAAGFELKSTMYVGSDIRGTARPVLLIFADDQPRHAKPIVVCNVVQSTVDGVGVVELSSCCGGELSYVTLTFTGTSHGFVVNNLVVYRNGIRGETKRGKVTTVSGAVVTVQAIDDANAIDTTEILHCCSNPDGYGIRGELLKELGSTLKTSSVFKVAYDSTTPAVLIETLKSLQATILGATGTLTLRNGETILFETTSAQAGGVFLSIALQPGETCDLVALDCTCLLGAIVTLD